MDPAENPLEESRRLRRTIRDLVALSTLPAVWQGQGRDGIARSLCDVLLNTLSLELIYLRLAGERGHGTIELVRGKNRRDLTLDERLKSSLAPLTEARAPLSADTIPDPFGGEMLHVAVVRFGIGQDNGALVACSRQPDFPTEQDRLLLGVGANQTAVVLQRRQREEQVTDQRELLHVTLASIGDAVIAADLHGHVTFMNAVAEELTGWASAEAEGTPLGAIFAIVNEDTRQPAQNPIAKVLQEGVVVGLANHTVLIARDGTERPIDDLAAPIRNAAGELIGVVLVFRDVTAQRQSERALRTSEARKSAMLETALDCIITMDSEGRIVEFNPAAERTFGFQRDQVVGLVLGDVIIPPAFRERHREGLARYLATGEGRVLGRRIELAALRADGSEFPVEMAITRISMEGQPLFTAYLRDISEQKRAEQHRTLRLAVTQVLSEAASVEQGATGVLRSVCEHLGWDLGFFWALGEHRDCLHCRAGWHRPQFALRDFETASCSRTFARGEGLPGRVWASNQPAWVLDLVHDSNFPRLAFAAQYGLHSAVAFPLLVGEQTLGVIEFFTSQIREADADLLETMGTLAGSVGQFLERKTAEDQLRRSEQELADFFENATVGLHWVGPDGLILRANQAELDMLGYKREEYIGRSICDFHADEEVICEILQKLKAGEKLADYPARLRCKNGEIKHVLIDSSVLWKKDEFIHTRCFTRDMTEQRRTELALAEARSRLDAALEAGAIATWSWDITNNRLVADANLNRLFNLPPSDAEGSLLDRYLQSIHPDDLPKVTEALRRSAEHGADYEEDYRIMQTEGTVRWVTARGRVERDEAGRPVRMPGVLVDVTERKRLEEELRLRLGQLAEADQRKEELLASMRESEEKLRLLADTIPQLAWMAHPDGSIFWYNRRWYEYTGTTADQMEGWGWQAVHDPAVLPSVLARWKSSIQSGDPFEMVFPLKGADQQFRPFLTRVNPLRAQEGHILYWFGTNTDISEIKRMEQALREADRRKDEFLATLAHELRNPLAPLRNSLQILKMPRLDAATAEEAREMMERQVHHLVRLVDDLLDMSRVMQGKIELRKEPVELATLVARAVETAQPAIEAAGHQLDLALPPESLLLEVDPVRIIQVIGNLLTNAAKYTKARGRIWVTAERGDGEAILKVRDNGIGIAPETLPHVFELFVQADHAATHSQGGLGIGLTLVRNLMEMHGGKVTARSAGLGHGCEVEVRLPLMTRKPPVTAENGTRQKPKIVSSGHRLLIVDDNQDAAISFARLLRLRGHEVEVAHDGPSALAVASASLPDLVFLDIGMPDMDGYEVARRMRQQSGLERVVLVALTGWGQEEDRRRTSAAGFDHHFVKPLDPDVLESLLSGLQKFLKT